ncbi:rRNA (cytidine-2'-O-)-methyltransferase [Loigolactobacillus backii]|uniref:Ribosomal RNA small subunit methyltransferase I n=1 Tax=Loigolactobacillus backii TaxID=375175 RepID=A0A192H2P0_9LACO|nr:16S rRNA (cytidine(1402)-2'-O)-methyltransferase [Loigolactobacillus backii]ANK62497.1 rRNA (cytidine-2'-O-)-methyltransferase [Loigolactobacillus backii]ANK70491.1 rRNA (cytidine-2'-O-)-methyltransferase [Loigolactobacillus backii]
MNAQQSFAAHDCGSLYLVPTPIGNLEDMTVRSINILKEVDLIAAEDTRNTQKLLNHFEIETKQISFHEHNTQERIPTLLKRLQNGESIAQVSDAGMPSISDPGHELVVAAIKADIPVIPIPGASAGLTALIASGLSPQPFYFYGFLSRQHKAQSDELAKLVNREETTIFYEAPHRLKKTLQAMAKAYGADRQVVLARELTKKFEEFLRGSFQEVQDWFNDHEVRGEFVILVAGNTNPTAEVDPYADLDNNAYVAALMEAGMTTKDAIKLVAKRRGVPKQDVYRSYHEF